MHPTCGPADFPTTRWTLVAAAGDHQRPESRRALSALCEAYWYPLYAYARRRGDSPEQAQDHTQVLRPLPGARLLRSRRPGQRTLPLVSAVVVQVLIQVQYNRVALDALMPGDGPKDRTERSEPEGIVVRNRDPMVNRLGGFQDDVAAGLMHLRVLPFSAQEVSEARAGNVARNLLCHRQDFVTNKVKANSLRPGPIEKEC
jgi:hypothetical protein